MEPEQYKSLADLLNKSEIGQKRFVADNIDDVLTSASAEIEATGYRPSASSFEKIQYGPLAGKTTWMALEKSKLFKDLGFPSLSKLLKHYNIGQDLKRRSIHSFSIVDIKGAVVSYINENDERPFHNSGDIPYPPFNNQFNWGHVNRAEILKKHGYASLHDFCNQENLGNARSFLDYTIEDVRSAVISYIEEHGKRPSSNLKGIPYPPFENRVTWSTINQSGGRNNGVLKEAGYKSLAEFCEVNNLGRSPFFTNYDLTDVHNAVVAFIKDNGKRPVILSGDIPYAPFDNQSTWQAVNDSKALSNAGYKSLKHFCDQNNLGHSRGFTDYAIEDVRVAIEHYIEEHGKRPSIKSGKIPYPPFNDRLTWLAISRSKVLKEAGYKSIFDFCQKNSLGIKTNNNKSDSDSKKRNPKFKYGFSDIVASIHAHFKNTGLRPSQTNGKIAYGPLAGKITWQSVNNSKFIKEQGYETLADLCDALNIGQRRVAKTFQDYNLEDILDAASKYFAENQKRPKKSDNKNTIQYGVLKDKTTWSSVDRALKQGFLSNEGFDGLDDLLDQHNIGQRRNKRWRTDYTLEEVILSVKAEFSETGQRPKIKNLANIQHGPLKNMVSWVGVNYALKSGHLKHSDYKDLNDLLVKHNIGRPTDLSLDITVENAIRSAKSEFNATGQRPKISDSEPIKYGPLKDATSWQYIDDAVRRGRLQNEKYKSLSEIFEIERIGKPKRAVPFDDFELSDVKSAILAYIADNDRRPSIKDGKILYPPFNGKKTWEGVNGCKKLKESGFKSLREFCDKNDLGQPKFFTDFTLEDIFKVIELFMHQNDGKVPNQRTGKIEYPPFNGQTTWTNIDQWLKRNKPSGYKSLLDVSSGIDLNNVQKSSVTPELS